jgi:hypothetical protein
MKQARKYPHNEDGKVSANHANFVQYSGAELLDDTRIDALASIGRLSKFRTAPQGSVFLFASIVNTLSLCFQRT